MSDIAFTHFDTVFSGQGRPGRLETGTFDACLAKILEPVEHTGPSAAMLSSLPKEDYDREKKKLPLWSSIAFDGNVRREQNFLGAFFIGFDVDGLPTVSEEEVEGSLSPYRAFAYTTSRSTAGALKWRVGVFLSEPVTSVVDYKATQEALAEAFRGIGATGSQDAARQFYYPRADAELIVLQTYGKPFDVVRGQVPKAYTAQTGGEERSISPVQVQQIVDILLDSGFRSKSKAFNRIDVALSWAGWVTDPGRLEGPIALADAVEVVRELGHQSSDWTDSDRTMYRIAIEMPRRRGSGQGGVYGYPSLVRDLGQDVADTLGKIIWGDTESTVRKMLGKKDIIEELADRKKGRDLKAKNEEHEYEYDPGTHVSNGDLRSTHVSKLITAMVSLPEWIGVLRWNEFANRLEAVDPPCSLEAEGKSGGLSNNDITLMQAYFAWKHNTKAQDKDVRAAAVVAAKTNRYHPVRNYLKALPARTRDEAEETLDGLARRLFGAVHPLEEVFLRKFLIQAVNRILYPGCQADMALVLYEKKGGTKKSTFVRELFSAKWSAPFGKSVMGDTEAARKLQGKWCFEIAEMAAMRAAQVEDVKAFMTTRSDYIRDLFGNDYYDRDRQCVLFGTTNDKSILHDEAHERRFGIIEVRQMIDIPYLQEHRDNIWAAAHALALLGEQYWLTDEEKGEASALLEDFREVDPWEDTIENYCRGKNTVQVKDIWELLSGAKEGTCDKLKEMRIAAVLKKLGCERKRVQVQGEQRWRWLVPDGLLKQTPPPNLGPDGLKFKLKPN